MRHKTAEQITLSIVIAGAMVITFIAGLLIGREQGPTLVQTKRAELLQLVADRYKAQDESCAAFRKAVETTDWCTGKPKELPDGK